MQQDPREQLRRGLAGLPTPKNDFEIVVPEDMTEEGEGVEDQHQYIEDQADLDNRSEAERRARSMLLVHHLAFSRIQCIIVEEKNYLFSQLDGLSVFVFNPFMLNLCNGLVLP